MPEDQQEVIAFLSDPLSYGEDRGEKVVRIETHISVLFLHGDIALKLKKSVHLPYLDYSTPALRKGFCEAELRLNRRTAPGIYQRVRAITREADGRLAFDGHGAALDWVVEMKRFEQAALLSAMAGEGGLTRPILEQLAEQIARFHQTAELAEGHGGAAGARRVIAMNDWSLRDAGLPAHAADQLLMLSREALARVEGLLDRRRDEGKVRRCHGDLHLGNICLFEDRPTLFDCIEFSDGIACIDILYDLAFVLMDLCHRGMRSEANILFNRYLDVMEEGEGLAALPLFISMRAAVRAHVLALSGTQTGRERGEGYLEFARRALSPSPPRLIAIGGLSGTGKSTVAAAIAGQLGAAPGARILRSDVLRKRRAGRAPLEPLGQAFYTREASHSLYREMRELAGRVLAAGYSVIIDAVSARAEERDAFEADALALGIPFQGFWLEAPAELLERRLAERKGDASDADAAVLRQQLGYEIGPMRWTRIAAAENKKVVIDRVERLLIGRIL